MADTPIVMLLDNHHGPDPRVRNEELLLAEHGLGVRVIAWDRRGGEASASETLVRIPVAAPAGGGLATVRGLARFSVAVLRRPSLLAGARLLVVHDLYLLPLAWLLSLLRRLPLVYDAHEEFAAMEALRYPPRALRAVTAIEGLLARRAKLIVVPGSSRVARWTAAGLTAPVVLRNIARDRPRGPALGDGEQPRWDLAYLGTLAEVRRIDVLLELARERPDLQVLIAGRGRGEREVADAAAALENVEYRGWVDDADALITQSRAVYYGLDPSHPYAAKACPNTLYDAIRLRRPLLHYCGGDVAEVSAQHRIGVRCEPTVASLAAALDSLHEGEWGFDAAWEELSDPAAAEAYVAAIRGALAAPRRQAGPGGDG